MLDPCWKSVLLPVSNLSLMSFLRMAVLLSVPRSEWISFGGGYVFNIGLYIAENSVGISLYIWLKEKAPVGPFSRIVVEMHL